MLTDRLLTALADFVVALRHHEVPDTPWDRAGVIANLRKLDGEIPAHRTAYAAIRRAADPRCTAPAFDQDGSHWDRGITCPKHPTAGMRSDGECAGCWIDRQPEPHEFVRTGVKPVPEPIAEQIRDQLQPAIPEPTAKRDVDHQALEQARAELDALRPERADRNKADHMEPANP